MELFAYVKDVAVDSVEMCKFEGKPVVVLLAQPGEHDHFMMRAAVFIYEHNDKRGSQGVILGRASAFSLGETAPGIGGVFAPNTLFMGGEMGPDMAVMFHKYDLKGLSKYIGGGIYVGALKEARELVENREAHPSDFKFIFNNVEWGPGVLESEITQGRWDVVRMPPEMILQQKQASSIWEQARNSLRSNGKSIINADDDG